MPSDSWVGVPWQGGQVGLLDYEYADGQLTVLLYIDLPADQVMLDQLQLYGFEQCAGYYSVEPEPPSEAEYLGEGQWQLTFPLPSDDLYYNNFLELSLLDADGVEDNSILISVPI